VVIGEAAAMPASLRALHDQAVSARVLGLTRLVDSGHGHPHLTSRTLQPSHVLRCRAAEGQGHHCDRGVGQQVQLGRPVVVVEARLTEPYTRTVGLPREPLRIRLYR
jgi:hypothetical protein